MSEDIDVKDEVLILKRNLQDLQEKVTSDMKLIIKEVRHIAEYVKKSENDAARVGR
jgi:hypothetical protein